jgi:hypothetical protein
MTTIHAGATVREVPGTALDLVGGVAGRGMRDNPTHLALYGDDPAWREIVHGAVMQHALAALGWPVLGAYDEAGTLVGVAGRGAPGACRRGPGPPAPAAAGSTDDRRGDVRSSRCPARRVGGA